MRVLYHTSCDIEIYTMTFSCEWTYWNRFYLRNIMKPYLFFKMLMKFYKDIFREFIYLLYICRYEKMILFLIKCNKGICQTFFSIPFISFIYYKIAFLILYVPLHLSPLTGIGRGAQHLIRSFLHGRSVYYPNSIDT